MLDFLGLNGPFRQPVGCVIESVPGSPLKHFHGLLSEVKVDASRNKASTASLTFTAPVDEKGIWYVQDSDEIAVGQPLIISARFSPLETVSVFEGMITTIAPSYPSDRGAAVVRVECRDNTILLDREFRKQSWSEDAQMDDVTLVAKIASENGLLPDKDNQNGLTKFTTVQNETDAAFMYDRACRSGYEFYTRGKTLYFGPMRLSADPQPTIMVYAGRQTNCIDFDVIHDAHKADKISASVPEAEGNKTKIVAVESNLDILGTAPAKDTSAPLGSNHYYMSRSQTPDLDDAEGYAQVLVNQESMSIKATGELDGALYGYVLQFGLPVGVSGGGKKYDGRYYVDTVEHNFSDKGYRQKFTLIRNGIGNDLPEATSRIAAITGG